MQHGLTVNGRHWNILIPFGGDKKLLDAWLGLAGGSSEFSCLLCEASAKQFGKCKSDWAAEGGLPLRTLQRVRRLKHFPEEVQYNCPACNKSIQPDSGQPHDASTVTDAKRQEEQRKHFGLTLAEAPWLPVEVHHFVIDILHLVLRVVPAIFRQTVAVNCDKQTMQKLAEYMRDEHGIVISSEALQSQTGKKTIQVAASSWDGKTCRKMLDHYEEMLQIAVPHHNGRDMELYHRCVELWDAMWVLMHIIAEGCNDKDHDSVYAHAAAVDAAGARVLTAYVRVSSREAVKSPYLHDIGCHLGDCIREWGSLTKFSCQSAESIHQWVKFFAKSRSNRKQWVGTTAKSILLRQEFLNLPARNNKKNKQQIHIANNKPKDNSSKYTHLKNEDAKKHIKIKTEKIGRLKPKTND